MGAEVCVCFGPETSPWYLSVNTYENAPLPPPTSSIFLTPSRGMRLTRLLAVATDPLCCAQEKHTVRCGKEVGRDIWEKWGVGGRNKKQLMGEMGCAWAKNKTTGGRNGVRVGEKSNDLWEKWGVGGRKKKRRVGEMGCGWAKNKTTCGRNGVWVGGGKNTTNKK